MHARTLTHIRGRGGGGGGGGGANWPSTDVTLQAEIAVGAKLPPGPATT